MTGFLDIAAAAKYLSRSPRWLRGNLSWLPHFRVNGQLLFRQDELQRAMEKFREPFKEIDLGEILDRAGVRPPRLGRSPGKRGAR